MVRPIPPGGHLHYSIGTFNLNVFSDCGAALSSAEGPMLRPDTESRASRYHEHNTATLAMSSRDP